MSFGNATVEMPVDSNCQPIQTLSPVDSTTVVGTGVTGTASTVTIPTGSVIVEIGLSDVAHWKFGATATTSNKVGVGVGIYKVPKGATQVSFLPVSGVASVIGSVTQLI